MRSNIRRIILAFVTVPLLLSRALAQPSAAPAKPAPPATRPSTAPATQPQGDYDVTDWVVLVVDANVPLANAAPLFKSSLPSFAESRRPAADEASADAKSPAPIGLIRFTNAAGADPDQKIDVLVEAKGGRFLAHWPKARSSADRELWKDVRLARDDAGAQPIEAAHWLAALRKPDSAWVNVGGRAEKFLLYDAEVAYPNPLKVEGGQGGAYQLTDAGAHPLHDLQLYKPAGTGWRTAGVDRLAPAGGGSAATNPNPPPAPPGAATPAPAGDAAAKAALDEAERQKQPPPAPATQPATTPTAPNSAKVTLGADASADAAATLAPWHDRLTKLGLAPADVETILAILAHHALEKDHLTAVYRIDPAELDNTLKLEVVPEPRKLTRVALVIARNIDPAIVEQIDGLVAQLGDADWNKREAAYKKLTEVGALAKPKLEAALNNKDLEVVWRAERLLAALSNPNAPKAPGR